MLIDPQVDELKALIAKEGRLIGARTRVTAITASADGDVAVVLVLLVAKGTLGRMGEDLYDQSKAAVQNVLKRLRQHYQSGIELDDGEVRVVLEEDLPAEAITQLGELLPEAPSGALRYDRKRGHWVDEADYNAEA